MTTPDMPPLVGQASPSENVILVNRRRRKSVLRDALFRPVFQALAKREAARWNGQTSVKHTTPYHPLFPSITLDPLTLPILDTLGPFPLTAEDLTNKEREREERNWRQWVGAPARPHRKPAEWRDLSDQYRLEWFHHAMSADRTAFTIHLNDKTAAQVSDQTDASSWMQKRLRRNLMKTLGHVPEFWFIIEIGEKGRPHLHGQIAAPADHHDAVRKAFRAAAGEWESVRQHQTNTLPHVSVCWPDYLGKDAYIMHRRAKDTPAYLSRPIQGKWYASTEQLQADADALYMACRKQVMELLPALRSSNTQWKAREPITVTAVLEDFSQDAADSTMEAVPVSGSPALTQGSPLTRVLGFESSDSRRDTETHQRPAMAVLEHMPSPATVERSNRRPP